jgi:hypothetical protein
MPAKKDNSKMKNSTKTNPTIANQESALNDPDTNKTILLHATNGKPLAFCRSLLLAAALLGVVPALHASDWKFNLIGRPSVEITVDEEEGEEEAEHPPEVIQMTGTGTFDPASETASGGGSFTMINAFDDVDVAVGGPDFGGKWTITDFVSWTPDSRLQVLVTLTFTKGLNEASEGLIIPGIGVTISEDGIILDLLGIEFFSTNPTGSAAFHLKKP